jgi:hypothetical protein
MKLTTTQVLGDECKAIADELLKQPELLAGVFLDSQPPLPDDQTIVGAVKQYNGNRSTTDDDRLLMVGALRVLGASDREIERACGVTRRTIPVLLEALEKSGRVTPLKERLIKLVGDNAERSSLVLRKLLEDAQEGRCNLDLAAMLKAVGAVNVFQLEKFQLLTGAATERIETVVGGGREEFERWWKETAVPVDSQSSALLQNQRLSDQNPQVDTSLETQSDSTADTSKRDGGGSDAVPPPISPMV